jgi:menaquinone-dependent protoporphyrinogen IX oxidase
MKGIIIYKGKYGATRQYAEWLGSALGFSVFSAGQETKEELAAADYILLGSSIYIGKLQIREWLEKNGTLLADKKVYLFIVAGTPSNERSKLEGYYKTNVPPDLQRRTRCYFLTGKLEFKKLSWLDKLLLKTGAMLAKRSGETISTTDYNEVRRENITSLIDDVVFDFNHQSVLQS